MGSVFSPHYARAREQGQLDPTRHLAINLALYGQKRAWVFTEAPAGPQSLTPSTLSVGNNTWRQTPEGVQLDIDDRTVPWGRRVRGRILLRGQRIVANGAYKLDARGRHHWQPVMPVGRIEVDMQMPKLRWQGHAYHDLNWGDEPVAQGFSAWSWMRVTRGPYTDILYAPKPQRGPAIQGVSLRCDAQGRVTPIPFPTLQPLARSGWGLGGEGFGVGAKVRIVEDTPFYRRATWPLSGKAGGGVAMHETLDLQRWGQPWVQQLMRFRLRRLREPA